jgi:hypothetical protein
MLIFAITLDAVPPNSERCNGWERRRSSPYTRRWPSIHARATFTEVQGSRVIMISQSQAAIEVIRAALATVGDHRGR